MPPPGNLNGSFGREVENRFVAFGAVLKVIKQVPEVLLQPSNSRRATLPEKLHPNSSRKKWLQATDPPDVKLREWERK